MTTLSEIKGIKNLY